MTISQNKMLPEKRVRRLPRLEGLKVVLGERFTGGPHPLSPRGHYRIGPFAVATLINWTRAVSCLFNEMDIVDVS
jgi:hypothetical protein